MLLARTNVTASRTGDGLVNTRRRLFRRTRDEDGAAAVEFALLLVPFLTLIFGMIQYGLYFYSAQAGSHVVSSAARQLSVGNCQASGALTTWIDNELGEAAVGSLTVTQTWKDPSGTAKSSLVNAGVGGTVTLEIEFDTLNMNFPLLPFLSDPTVRRTVDVRIEDTTDGGCPA